MPWRTAWIIGGSSGIGAEAVNQLARAGVRVTVSARRAEVLTDLAEQDNVTALPLDVTDRAAVADAVAGFEALPDLIIQAAAIYEPMDRASYDAETASAMMRVNFDGVANCLSPLMARAAKDHESGRGKPCRIAVIASPSGYRGLVGGAGYGPTKAAVINLVESLKPEMEPFDTWLSLVNPGFVRTQLTAKNRFPMPQLMEPEDAARAMLAGLAKGRFEVAFPNPFLWFLRRLRCLPYGLYFALMRRMV